MLEKVKSLVASIDSKVNKPLCILLGIIVGYATHPLLSVVLDIAKIPFKIMGLL